MFAKLQTQYRLAVKLSRAEQHAEAVRRKNEIKQVFHSNDIPKKKIPTSKIGLGFVIMDFLAIQVFCMWYMVAYPENSDLGAFIGIAIAILGQVRALVSYNKKSTAENSVGGIVYESTLHQSTDLVEESVG